MYYLIQYLTNAQKFFSVCERLGAWKTIFATKQGDFLVLSLVKIDFYKYRMQNACL